MNWNLVGSIYGRSSIKFAHLEPKKSRHFLMHWMNVKLPDNFQMREHSWPCRFQRRRFFLEINQSETRIACDTTLKKEMGNTEIQIHSFLSSPCQCELLPSFCVCRSLTFHILIFSSETPQPHAWKVWLYMWIPYYPWWLVLTYFVMHSLLKFWHVCATNMVFIQPWKKKWEILRYRYIHFLAHLANVSFCHHFASVVR
jgi:hypothetical protein